MTGRKRSVEELFLTRIRAGGRLEYVRVEFPGTQEKFRQGEDSKIKTAIQAAVRADPGCSEQLGADPG